MAKGKRILKRIALAGMLLFIVGAIGAWLLIESDESSFELVPLHLEKTFDGLSVENLAVASDVSDIRVVHTAAKDIAIRVTGEYPKRAEPNVALDASVDSSRTLKADIRMKRPFSIGADLRLLAALWKGHARSLFPVVTVEIPEQAFRYVHIESHTGDITLPALESAQARLENDTGSISFEAFRGDRLQASTHTGSIRLDRAESEVSLESDTGDIELNVESLSRNVLIRTDTGSIVMSVKSPVSAQLDLRTDTGRITSDLPLTNMETRQQNSLKGTAGVGGPLVNIRTDTGNITLRNR